MTLRIIKALKALMLATLEVPARSTTVPPSPPPFFYFQDFDVCRPEHHQNYTEQTCDAVCPIRPCGILIKDQRKQENNLPMIRTLGYAVLCTSVATRVTEVQTKSNQSNQQGCST
jgi:hypothetical protein